MYMPTSYIFYFNKIDHYCKIEIAKTISWTIVIVRSYEIH